jgi:hypothetical protein
MSVKFVTDAEFNQSRMEESRKKESFSHVGFWKGNLPYRSGDLYVRALKEYKGAHSSP